MKTFIKRFASIILVVLMLLSAVACKDKDKNNSSSSSGNGDNETEQIYDPETRAFTMSIGAMDGTFNPFFFTAQNDGTVVSMTQVSMLASDANGKPVCGEDRPTVAKDFYYEEKTSGGKKTTEYNFLIKNGMKYSDGDDLNLMDVLFNLYVYLDEAYTGSNTLYSTKIKGLNAYRAQNPQLSDDVTSTTSAQFYAKAATRLDNVVLWCESEWVDDEAQVEKDIETIKKLFKEEIRSDWTTVENSFNGRDLDTYEYRFTEVWEAYYFNEGIISVQTEQLATGATVQKKDENGKYLTDLDKKDDTYRQDMEDAVTEEAINKYLNDGVKNREDAINYVKRDYAISVVEQAYTSTDSGIAQVAQYWATASNALEAFAAEERTKHFDELMGDSEGLAVETISGITTYRTNTFNGKQLDGTYDALKIVIDDVDPKAIWNFAFTVAPMHYYSTQELTAQANADYEAYKQAYANGNSYTLTKFGVKFADDKFFGEEGLQAGDKNALPIGAGAYKASKETGGNGTADTFNKNKFVYYERNEYFTTMGKELTRPIIKSVRFAELGDDKVISALINEEIDYGMPSGNAENSNQIGAHNDYLGYAKYDSNGYGYVGINPKFVPDIEVRQAIMMAMNTAATVSNYYTSEWASVIYRPMSKTSWAYPFGSSEYYSFTRDQATIRELVESAGYKKNASGIYEKDGKQLKLTFTIAGNSKEHPAYYMFTDAEKFLEQCGFDITVSNDIQALKKLATGNLAVWAAAWSSAIDPDMYQVYHKGSKASSVKNWNYPEIIANVGGKWDTEKAIVDELSEVIDNARKTTNLNERKRFYKDALDLVMELAVELPTYQRMDYEVYNKRYIDSSTLTANPSSKQSLIDRIWEINYN